MHNKSCESLTDPRIPIPGTTALINSADMKKEIARVTPLRKSPRLSDKQRRNYETKTKVPPKQQLTRVKKEALGLHALCKHCGEAIQVRLADLFTGICGVQTIKHMDDGTCTGDFNSGNANFLFLDKTPKPEEFHFCLYRPQLVSGIGPKPTDLFSAADRAISSVCTSHQLGDVPLLTYHHLPWKTTTELYFNGIRISLEFELLGNNAPNEWRFIVSVEPFPRDKADTLAELHNRANKIINGPDENPLKSIHQNLCEQERNLLSQLENTDLGDYHSGWRDRFDGALPLNPREVLCFILYCNGSAEFHERWTGHCVETYKYFLEEVSRALEKYKEGHLEDAKEKLAGLHDVIFVELLYPAQGTNLKGYEPSKKATCLAVDGFGRSFDLFFT